MIVLEGGGLSSQQIPIWHTLAEQAVLGAVLESGKVYVQQLEDTKDFQSVYPIICLGGKCGFLEIISAKHSEQDQRIVQALLKIFSNYLGLFLESETDTLTGLLNRRTFDQNIEKIVADRALSDSAEADSTAARQVRRTTGLLLLILIISRK